MNQGEIAKLIERLEHVGKRSSMYVGSFEIEPLFYWLAGFMVAVWTTTYKNHFEIYKQIIDQRGWNFPPANGRYIYHEMVERGMTAEKVIEELVAIEIDVLNYLAKIQKVTP